MKENAYVMNPFLDSLDIRIYQDRSGLTGSKQGPLVWTEVFLREVNRQNTGGILHYWPMERTVILGMMDSQVPDLKGGLAPLDQAGYNTIIRSLGGLAVVADQGVLNLSLILPNPQGHKLELHQTYGLMVELISQALSDFPVQVEAGEVHDSYCPGTYDLSIGGRKFAGLAQRIYQKAIAISAYISVTGDQAKRGQLVADFYQAAFTGQEISDRYPKVNPASMANLSELLGQEISLDQFKERFQAVLQSRNAQLSSFYPSSDKVCLALAFGCFTRLFS